MSSHRSALTLIILLASTGISRADLFLPAGLAPGDKYRIVFVTSTPHDALSPNIADYNMFVNDTANAMGTVLSGLNTTWNAIATTQNVDAHENTGTDPNDDPTGFPIFLADGMTKIADTNTDLWDGDIDSFINRDENNVVIPSEEVWTGTIQSGGTLTGLWLGTPLGNNAIYGTTDRQDDGWVDVNSGDPRTDTKAFYGLSAPLTAVPEPSAFICMGLGGLGLLGWKKLKRVRQS